MTSSLSSNDITMKVGPANLSSNLLKRNISLSTVGDKYSFTRARTRKLKMIWKITKEKYYVNGLDFILI